MNKVALTTTTTNNDNFQRVVSNMLKQMQSSTNHILDITQTDDNKIVIQPMNGRSFNIDFNTTPKKSKEKKMYYLHDEYNDIKQIVRLSDESVEFLKWLRKHDFMTCEFEFEELTDMEIAEF